MAIEPFLRRRWPQVLVSWMRLLAGDWRDPLVARDVFVGLAFAVVVSSVLRLAYYVVPLGLGYAELSPPAPIGFDGVIGARFFLCTLVRFLLHAVLNSLVYTCLLFIMRLLLRNQMAALAVSTVLFALLEWSGNSATFAVILVLSPIFFIALLRFGFVAAVSTFFADQIFLNLPVTLDTSAWYSGYGYAAIAILATILLFSFRFSLGGRPLLAPSHLDD